MSRPKSGVLLVTPPADWRPQRFHSFPPSITTATIYGRNLTVRQAVTVARTYNLAHLQPAAYEGRWALVVYSLARGDHRYYGPRADVDQDAASGKGGAA